jgi:hypothetical protein
MEVNDPRPVTDFQKTTFCGHPRSHVTKVLIQNIQLGHADYTCYWTLELLCSGLVHTLWDTLFDAAALHINRAQPQVFLYLADAYEKYAPYEAAYAISNMTSIRNNLDVRNAVCRVAATLSLCRKSKLPSLPTMKPAHDFDPVTIRESLKAPSSLFGRLVLRPQDPLPVAVPINEFVYCLRPDVRDLVRCLYWMSWTLAYAKEHKKQTKENLIFADRSDEFVVTAHGNHIVWLFWDAVKKQTQAHARPVVDVLYKMYTLRWSPTEARSKQPLLVAAIVLVCEGTTLDTTIVSGDSAAVSNVLGGMPGWIDAITRMQKSFST